jgi:hypothetical protein
MTTVITGVKPPIGSSGTWLTGPTAKVDEAVARAQRDATNNPYIEPTGVVYVWQENGTGTWFTSAQVIYRVRQ